MVRIAQIIITITFAIINIIIIIIIAIIIIAIIIISIIIVIILLLLLLFVCIINSSSSRNIIITIIISSIIITITIITIKEKYHPFQCLPVCKFFQPFLYGPGCRFLLGCQVFVQIYIKLLVEKFNDQLRVTHLYTIVFYPGNLSFRAHVIPTTMVWLKLLK